MDMEETSINALVDAKTEYTKQLTGILSPLIYEGFQSIYNEANEIKENTEDPRYDDFSNLKIFQDFLRKIPKWNQDIIDTETERIIQKTNCKWLEKLIGAVFISNAKVLSTIRTQNFDQKMKLEIPNTSRFIHKCYIEAGREFYRNVYLFDDDDISPYDKQKNIRECLSIIKDSIQEAIRRLLPVQEIIKTYLGNVYSNADDDISVQSEQFMNETLDKYADATLKENMMTQIEERESDNDEEVFEQFSPRKENENQQMSLIEEFISKNENENGRKTPQDAMVEKLLNSEETTISDEILKQLSDNEEKNNVSDKESEKSFTDESINKTEEELLTTNKQYQTEEATINERILEEKDDDSIVIDENVEKELESKYSTSEKQIVIKDKKKNMLREKLLRRQALQKKRKEEELRQKEYDRKLKKEEQELAERRLRLEQEKREYQKELERTKQEQEEQEEQEEEENVEEENVEEENNDYVFFADQASDEELSEEEEILE